MRCCKQVTFKGTLVFKVPQQFTVSKIIFQHHYSHCCCYRHLLTLYKVTTKLDRFYKYIYSKWSSLVGTVHTVCKWDTVLQNGLKHNFTRALSRSGFLSDKLYSSCCIAAAAIKNVSKNVFLSCLKDVLKKPHGPASFGGDRLVEIVGICACIS